MSTFFEHVPLEVREKIAALPRSEKTGLFILPMPWAKEECCILTAYMRLACPEEYSISHSGELCYPPTAAGCALGLSHKEALEWTKLSLRESIPHDLAELVRQAWVVARAFDNRDGRKFDVNTVLGLAE